MLASSFKTHHGDGRNHPVRAAENTIKPRDNRAHCEAKMRFAGHAAN
jgi:hypothetical protein